MTRTSLLLLGALATGALAGCGDSDGGSAAPAAGRVTVHLTDEPAPFAAAVVTITRIALVPEEGPPVVVFDDEVTTDLLTLADQPLTLAEDVAVPGGDYRELRLVITGGYLEVVNPDLTTSIFASSPDYPGLPAGAVVEGELQMPSFGSSGLKVDISDGGLAVSGDDNTLLVDFEVLPSFAHETGTDKWVLSPVITARETGE